MSIRPYIEPYIPAVASAVIPALRASWRVAVRGTDNLEGHHLYALWHGRQLALTAGLGAARRRSKLVAMVSASRDGQLQRPILASLGIDAVTGSSSRRASSGLVDLARCVRRGDSAIMAVDGPAGPAHCAKSGIVALCRMTSVSIVPVGVEVSRSVVVPNTWDGFIVPIPGARVEVTFGAPIAYNAQAGRAGVLDQVQRALAALNRTVPVSLRQGPDA